MKKHSDTGENQALKNSNSYLRTLVQTIPDLIWLKDENGVFIDCNSEFERFFGAKRADIIGKTDYDFLEPCLADFFRDNDRKAMLNDSPTINEEAIVYADGGKEVLLETIKTPMKDQNGSIIGILGIGREITQRKATEQSLKKRLDAVTEPAFDDLSVTLEDLFDLAEIQELQDHFSNGTKVASIITKPNGEPITQPSNFCYLCEHIIRETPTGCQNCYKSDSIIGRYKSDGPTIQLCKSGGLWDAGAAITVGGKHIANWLIGQVRNEAQTEENILKYADEIGADPDAMKKAYQEVPSMSYSQFESISKMLFSMAGQLSKTAYQNYLQARHINERKQFEQRILRINEKLKATSEALKISNDELNLAVKKAEESDRLKSAFLANISHEIRTPLNAIMGFSSFLNDPNTTNEEIKNYVEIINQNGNNLLDLISSIIHISKIDAGLIAVEKKPTDITAILVEIEGIHRLKLVQDKQKKIQLSLRHSAKKTIVTTDPILFRQVIDNLIHNAIKFTNSGEIELGLEKKDDQWCCWVKDSGIGIHPKYHTTIFDRFRKETSEDKNDRLYGGTGIGLSIAKASVELMGGKIWVESEEEHGATFFFSIPCL